MERTFRSCIHDDADTLVVSESTIMRPPWVHLAATRLWPTSLKIDGFQEQKMSRMSSPETRGRALLRCCAGVRGPTETLSAAWGPNIDWRRQHCTGSGGSKLYLKTSIHLELRGVGRCIDNIETIASISDFIIIERKNLLSQKLNSRKMEIVTVNRGDLVTSQYN